MSNDAWTVAQSGGVAGALNIPKDLSLLNRRGYASTTRKGVPLIYRVKVDLYATNFDGTGTSAAVGTDFVTTLRARGCQNNWVMKNAAVKFHAAREKMFRDAGVKKTGRGAYSHEIRYGLDAHNDAWIVPVDGDGSAFTGGTWDVSELTWGNDSSFTPVLISAGDDEETDLFSGSKLQIGHSYLLSRLSQQADTNLPASEGPAKFSVLLEMLSDKFDESGRTDDIRETARDDQDNPPYEVLDLSDSGDINHDITEPVELGRCLVGPGAQYASMIMDVPFGLCDLYLQHYDAADTNTTHNPMWTVEVLDIFEMQG